MGNYKIKLNIINGTTICEAINKRDLSGFRYDNSKYWKEYYATKLKLGDISRERSYAKFLYKLLGKNKRVLDVASGCGFLSVEMAKVGFKVEGADKYEDMIKLAKRYFSKKGYDINIYKTDITSLPIDNEVYDLVTAQSILEHFCYDEMVDVLLPELKRVIKKDGWLMVHMPVKSGVTFLKKYFRKYIKRDLPKWAIDDDGDATHKIWLTAQEYLHELKKQELDVKYFRFNFVRSNENINILRVFDRVLESWGGSRFHEIKKFSKFKFNLLSFLGVSVVYISQKNSI